MSTEGIEERNIRYYGKPDPLPEQLSLRAGPLSLFYENGDLRYIRLGETEIVRRIYVAVRNHNWDTIAPLLSNVKMTVEDDSFAITYDVVHRQDPVDFRWQGTIRGDAQGTILFRMSGEAHGTFQRNRIGFCVLHPMACAGVPSRVEHVDGSTDELPFPTTIARQLIKNGHPWPVAPFDNMRSLAHQVQPGLWATVRFEGDVFELEDQRNWTDASYKTYGTPLSLPFPQTVESGTTIEQAITLTLAGSPSLASDDRTDNSITLSVEPEKAKPLPTIGLGVASHHEALSAQEVARLQALNLHHLRVDLQLWDTTFLDRLPLAAQQARALGVALEVALFLTDNARDELANLVTQLRQVNTAICRWLIFHRDEKSTSAQWVALAREMLLPETPDAKLGGGSNAYFTEINAVRPEVETFDFVSYSLNPQVHAFDNSSVVETLEAQAVTVESARQLADGKAVVVSPVTLLPRFNPNATGPEPEPAPGELPPQVDERQMSLFGGAWTVGSLKYLCRSALESVTYYETTGWRGVMERAKGSLLPDKFFSQASMVFPLYHALADVGEFADGEILGIEASHPLTVDGLALRQADRMRVLVTNLTGEPQQVMVKGLAARSLIRYLDESTFEQATQFPEVYRGRTGDMVQTTDGELRLTLSPYATVRIVCDSTHD